VNPAQRLEPQLLRKALIDQALSYIGTPYMRRASTHIAAQKPWSKHLPKRLKPAAPVAGAHDKPQAAFFFNFFFSQAADRRR
jgi:hypothetical protein